MDWETPSFVEIRMDAEVSAYQDDSDPTRDPNFAPRAVPPPPESDPAQPR